jgi:hypothetical protein
VAPSASVEKLETRDHAPAENGTWPWHRQRLLNSSKHKITHHLRAGHGRGTVNILSVA